MTCKLVKYKKTLPTISNNVFLADGVVLAGDIVLKEGANIWFNSVIRGDVAPVIIGKNTNVQDGCVIHTSREEGGETIIGDNVTVGHMALLHACTIKDNAFIGMSSTIMDNAIIEENGFVAAGSLVTPGKTIKSKELWAGSPAKFVRYITDEELKTMRETIKVYLDLAQSYKKEN